MKKSKWPDFLVTVAFRFIGGFVLGGGAGVICMYRVILRSFARNHISGPVILVGLFGLIGGIIAACKTPYWQTPWYKGIDHDTTRQIAEAFSRPSPRPPTPGTEI
jgi:hypothetical protein